jgi:hypothetical protein
MNVNGLLETLQQQGLTGAGQRLVLQPDPEFASTLTLGQIIKGKVLRQYEGNRYAVSFGGREKVVDSSIPLRNGEILYGRVIGLDDKVQLQRVYADRSQSVQPAPDSTAGLIATPAESRVLRLFEQYRAALGAGDLRMLGQLVRTASQPELMALSGLVLNKLGMTLQPVLVRALYRVLHEAKPAALDETANAGVLTADAGKDGAVFNREAIEQLARALSPMQMKTQTQERREPDAAEGRDADADGMSAVATGNDGAAMSAASDDGHQFFDTPAGQEWLLGRFLLNVQSEGSVAHRLASFPIWFGDRLIEVEMALFTQQRDTGQEDSGDIQYRKLVFSLDTEGLGHVEISVHVANRNLRVIVATDNEPATGELAQYLPDLKHELAAFGWQLDELSYRTTESDLQGNVIRSVVEHYISQDSLSRLM